MHNNNWWKNAKWYEKREHTCIEYPASYGTPLSGYYVCYRCKLCNREMRKDPIV